jgi:hypothetical protein
MNDKREAKVIAFHPLANLLPLMEDGSPEFKDLTADIKANGLQAYAAGSVMKWSAS